MTTASFAKLRREIEALKGTNGAVVLDLDEVAALLKSYDVMYSALGAAITHPDFPAEREAKAWQRAIYHARRVAENPHG